jgi:hypothetical protein
MNNKILKTIFYIFIVLFILAVIGFIVYYQVVEYYQQLDPMLKIIQETLHPLHEKVKTLAFFEGNKSYTINKKKIYLCLKDEHQEYYDFNMLMYVAIHELSHVLCDEIGHTPKFNRIFQEQLEKAEELGIYDSSKPIIQNYCGHK